MGSNLYKKHKQFIINFFALLKVIIKLNDVFRFDPNGLDFLWMKSFVTEFSICLLYII